MHAVRDEQLIVHQSARMGVRVADWPDGETGIMVDIGESSYLFTLAGAGRLKDALEQQLGIAGDLDKTVPRA